MFCIYIYIYIYRQESSCPGGCLGSIPSFQCKFESLSCHNFGKKIEKSLIQNFNGNIILTNANTRYFAYSEISNLGS